MEESQNISVKPTSPMTHQKPWAAEQASPRNSIQDTLTDSTRDRGGFLEMHSSSYANGASRNGNIDTYLPPNISFTLDLKSHITSQYLDCFDWARRGLPSQTHNESILPNNSIGSSPLVPIRSSTNEAPEIQKDHCHLDEHQIERKSQINSSYVQKMVLASKERAASEQYFSAKALFDKEKVIENDVSYTSSSSPPPIKRPCEWNKLQYSFIDQSIGQLDDPPTESSLKQYTPIDRSTEYTSSDPQHQQQIRAVKAGMINQAVTSHAQVHSVATPSVTGSSDLCQSLEDPKRILLQSNYPPFYTTQGLPPRPRMLPFPNKAFPMQHPETYHLPMSLPPPPPQQQPHTFVTNQQGHQHLHPSLYPGYPHLRHFTPTGLQPHPSTNSFGYGLDGARRKNATRESTTTLKVWLQEHIKNPYPTKGEKIMLAIITKMTLTQVSTWFANARRRLKKENKMSWPPKSNVSNHKSVDGEKSNTVTDKTHTGNNSPQVGEQSPTERDANSRSPIRLEESETEDDEDESSGTDGELDDPCLRNANVNIHTSASQYLNTSTLSSTSSELGNREAIEDNRFGDVHSRSIYSPNPLMMKTYGNMPLDSTLSIHGDGIDNHSISNPDHNHSYSNIVAKYGHHMSISPTKCYPGYLPLMSNSTDNHPMINNPRFPPTMPSVNTDQCHPITMENYHNSEGLFRNIPSLIPPNANVSIPTHTLDHQPHQHSILQTLSAISNSTTAYRSGDSQKATLSTPIEQYDGPVGFVSQRNNILMS